MAHKDPVKRKEYQDEYNRKRRKRLPRPPFHDFETHRELAINSGIRTQREWTECSERGFLPDGIYSYPAKIFKRSE